jgi:hypothetical protein
VKEIFAVASHFSLYFWPPSADIVRWLPLAAL